MSDVIDRPILEQEKTAATRLRIIDCDIHPSIHAHSDLNEFLPKRWQEHLKTYGSHLRTPYIGTTPYPRSSPLIARRDAWPPTGGPPGSNLDFMRKQHLDPLDIEFGILQVLDLFIFSQQNLEFGAAIQRAINDWQLAFWSHRDPRLKASILAGQDDTQLAIAEIDRCAKTGEYIQINVSPRANEPLGRRRYWPIYARAQELGLPLGIHVGGYGGHAPTGGGWPSYYCEEHQSNAHTVAAQLTSLGYETIAVADGRAALALVDKGEKFDLLFTDVIMPGPMNGRQLANEAEKRLPALKSLYTSGYTENAIVHHGRLDSGVLLLAKPYRKAELAKMIRTALGS